MLRDYVSRMLFIYPNMFLTCWNSIIARCSRRYFLALHISSLVTLSQSVTSIKFKMSIYISLNNKTSVSTWQRHKFIMSPLKHWAWYQKSLCNWTSTTCLHHVYQSPKTSMNCLGGVCSNVSRLKTIQNTSLTFGSKVLLISCNQAKLDPSIGSAQYLQGLPQIRSATWLVCWESGTCKVDKTHKRNNSVKKNWNALNRNHSADNASNSMKSSIQLPGVHKYGCSHTTMVHVCLNTTLMWEIQLKVNTTKSCRVLQITLVI